jgi:uncharacterized protein YjiS (DUF1127 family)
MIIRIMNIRFRYASPVATFQVAWGADRRRAASLNASPMETAMYDGSIIRSGAPGQRQATIFDDCLAAAAAAWRGWVAAIAHELRIRRDMRQLAAMDDHMLKDIGLCRCEIESCARYGRDQ